MFEQKQWYWKRRTRLYVGSRELKSTVSKFKGSIFAVLLGLIIGSLIIEATGNSFITYFTYMIFYAFSSYGTNNWDSTLVWWSLYIVAGLALVMSFKTGMFNIGVTGQMLAAATVIITIGVRYNLAQPLMLIFAFFAAVLAAMLVAAVISLLKVLFNVHEVVSSILLNWTIWYFIKWVFLTSSDLYDNSQGASTQVHDNLNLLVGGYKFIIPIILAFTLVIFVWFLLKKTAIGYKFKTVGLNPFAAKYAGISNRKYALISFIISGALAGVMAFIFYIGLNPSLSFSTDDLPTLGFDSISIALVGQINAFGVVGAALLWGIIKSGGTIGSTGLNIPNAVGDIIFGVIIYSAACAVLLSRLEPIKFTIRYFNVILSNDKRSSANGLIAKIWNTWIGKFKVKKEYNKKIKLLKKSIKEETKKGNLANVESLNQQLNKLITDKKDNIQVIWSQIHQEYIALNYFLHKEYDNIWKHGALGIKNRAIKNKKWIYGQKLNEYVKNKIAYEEYLYDAKEELSNNIKLIKQEHSSDFKVKINSVAKDFASKIIQKNQEFNQSFLTMIKNENQEINKINDKLKIDKKTYQENIKLVSVTYKEQLQKIKITFKKVKDASNDKEKIKEAKLAYKKQKTQIKEQYIKNKEKHLKLEFGGGQ